MATKDFRFGVNVFTTGSKSVWQDAARHVEDLGYDVLLVPDHLGMIAPFPAVVSAAEVTNRPRLGTLVLNSGFYRPALLARDVGGAHELTDGRFEFGIGAGWVAEEFEAAGLPFPSGRKRMEHLDNTVTEVGRLLGEAGQRVPLMIGGNGDRLLTIAGRNADIVNITGGAGPAEPGQPDPLTERIEFLRAAAGERFADIELCMLLSAVNLAKDGEPDLSMPRQLYRDLSDEQIMELPGVLYGTEQDIADSIRALRDTYGFSYFTTVELGRNLESLGAVLRHFS